MASGDPWWRDGLRFECTRCGNCCGGAPGTVRVSDAEIEALARRVEFSDAEFRAAFTRELRGGDRSLRERRDGTCVFYDARRGCKVYPDRPHQFIARKRWRAVSPGSERPSMHPS